MTMATPGRRPPAGVSIWLSPLAWVLATGGLLGGCAAAPPDPNAPTPRLAAYLKGTFIGDAPDGDAEIRLRAEPVFVDRWQLQDGLYLLIERRQGGADARQELWRLVPGTEGRAVIQTWLPRRAALPAEHALTGRVMADSEVEALGPEAFHHLRDCDLALTLRANGEFSGGHGSQAACRWEQDGGDTLWRRLTLTPNQILWWERGFTSAGTPAWGPEDGIVFDRLER
ncbi:MAG: hypothetical protein EA371_11285 [Gammaproteobacteria bacterium]|nr:MAG: hypothetical protein EA371_11285 [Gammaproteobacteria bacterium]